MMRCQFVSRMPEIRRNLLHLYRHDTITADIESGSQWYPRAHAIVCEWADTYSLPIACVASVVAAISPQCSWDRNLIIADDVLADRPVSIGGAITSFVAKARLIKANRSTDITAYFPQGPKVASFAVNLAGDYSHATIDTHAMQAALCDVHANYRLPWTPYAIFAQCYVDVATTLRIEPATFQAILWHTWKRLYPRTVKQQERCQWHVIGELED